MTYPPSGDPYSPFDSPGQGEGYGGPYGQPYGATPPQYGGAPMPYGYGGPQPTNTMAIVSLVCSIIGVFTCGVTSVVGVVFGHVAMSQIKRTGEEGRGMAITGLILGYVFTLLWVFAILAYFGLLAMLMADLNSFDYV